MFLLLLSPDDCRWLGVFVRGDGDRLVFLPGFAQPFAFTDAVKPANHPVSVNPGPYDLVDYTYLAYWPRPGGTFVVAANGSNEKATLQIPLGTDFAGRTLVPWDADTSALTLDAKGQGAVAAEPYDVFLWVVQ